MGPLFNVYWLARLIDTLTSYATSPFCDISLFRILRDIFLVVVLTALHLAVSEHVCSVLFH